MTDRRSFIQSASAVVAAAPGLGRVRLADPRPRARPTAAQLAWADLEVGMFIHFAPNTWQDSEGDDRSTPLSRINPTIDTDQWAEVARSLGARYIVMVAKHVGGFCLWQTKTNRYSIGNTPWRNGKGDVMADLTKSCEARGLKLGVYLSPRDDSLGAGVSGRCQTPALQERYNRIARQQLTELVTRYGPMVEVWFDGSSVVPVGDILTRHARGAMIFQGPHATIRWVGNEDGFAPYPAWNSLAGVDAKTGIATAIHGDPDGDAWLPNEVDVSIRRPHWFWHTDNEANLLTLNQLIEIYYRSVGRGAQLLLNIPPDRTGKIPAADASRAREAGDTIRQRFGKPIGATAGAGSETILELGSPHRLDHIVLEEDLSQGERVRAFQVEFADGREWVSLARGTAIGHKRILPFPPTDIASLRLTVTQSNGTPRIRRLAAFASGAPAPATWNDPAPVWADDEVGKWEYGRFDIDLGMVLKDATTYRVRFVGLTGPARVTAAEVTIGETAAPQLLRPAAGRQDVLMLTLPEAGRVIRLRGAASGSARGTVLARRI